MRLSVLQKVAGVKLYIVNLTEDPKSLLPIRGGWDPRHRPYARALDTAIRQGVITEPGKYGIKLSRRNKHYDIHLIIEN